jgi:group I intron endonuclease
MLKQSAYFESPVIERLPAAFNYSGVYGIRHTASGRIYVGSAKDIRARIYQHLGALLSRKHHSRYLQNAWNKYGQSAFTLILLEKGVIERLIEREQFWIDHFDSYENGFNARPKAESMRGVKWSKAQNKARSQSNRTAWSNETLRQKLSARFKGQHRGVWTANSRKKVTQTLKQRHAENPEWRKNAQKWLHSPENEAKRIAASKAALKRPEVYSARVKQLREARKSPASNSAIRKAYFEKFNRKSLGFKNPDEMDQACLKFYSEGKSCREIGRLFHIDHHAISSRLRRLGVYPKRISKIKVSTQSDSFPR